MRRSEVWTVSGGKDYAGKPRPVVIIQDDAFDATELHHGLCPHNRLHGSATVPAAGGAE